MTRIDYRTSIDWKKVWRYVAVALFGTISVSLLIGIGCHVLAWTVGIPVQRLFVPQLP